MNFIVYKTTNLINGYIYIGVHHTSLKTFDGYIGNGVAAKLLTKPSKNATKFRKAVYRYGYENFKRETLAVFEDSEKGEAEAYALESKIVTKEFLKRKDVYNMALGGKFNDYIINKKSVYQFDLAGNLLKVWKSVVDASDKFSNPNAARTAIGNVCRGITHQAYGYYWSYKHIFNYNKYNWTKAVARYDDDGRFLESYSSLQDAAKALHISSTANISHAISGQQKHCCGYRWRLFYGNTQNIKPLK